MLVRLAAVALVALALGCGRDDGAPEFGPDRGLGGVPPCESTWVDGRRLPTDYAGCRDGDVFVSPAVARCGPGAADLVTYAPRGSGFFTAADGTVVEAGAAYADDPRYRDRRAGCR